MRKSGVIIIGFAGILVSLFVLYQLVVLIFNYLSITNFNPNIIVALIAGVFTVSGYFLTRYFERKKIEEQQIREQKLPVYEEFVSFTIKVIMDVKGGKETNQEEMVEFMTDFTKKSIVWLSDSSLKSYSNWRKRAIQYSNKGDNGMDEALLQLILLEDMFFEFRKDIGHSNKGLKRGDLLSLFITDLHKYKLN